MKKYTWKNYGEYMRDNPKGLWFKMRLYGWGWVPVRWQGWLVVLFSLAIVFLGVYIGEIDDAPGVVLLGVVIAIVIIFVFGFWKGEKPKWNWGLNK